MKMYLNVEQTAKLMELGFEKPKSINSIKVTGDIITTAEDLIGEPTSVMGGKITANYSIGELIEMLPDYMNGNYVKWKIQTTKGDVKWSVGWDCFETEQFQWIRTTELIDALFDMIVQLKEEGVI